VTTPSHPSHSATHRFSSESFDACIFVGGDSPHAFVASVVGKSRLVVAADSGWRHALSVGVTPQVVLGDFDSISADELHAAREAKVPLLEYPTDKDLTDAEIALQHVADSDATSVLVISGGGDRFDHLLAIIHALCSSTIQDLRRCAIVGDTRIDIVTPTYPLALSGDHGQLVSLIPIGGDSSGVTTHGLRWALQSETLYAAQSRGISNVLMDDIFSIAVSQGHLAVLQPHYFPPSKENK
jgi:thiamine pyrophosphokinase